MTPTQPFRAGRLPAERVGAADTPVFEPSIDITLMADISEFQSNINDAVYLDFSLAAIIRAAYGAHHDDLSWFGGQRRDLLHAGGAKFVGIYQYIVAGQSIASQFAEFAKLVGPLRKGEKVIADIEEGSGNQAARWDEWRSLAEDRFGDVPWDYSGLNFAATHGLQPVNWVAAYGQTEPSVTHDLWQFTDAFHVPGVGVADCSVYHGSVDQLAALAFGGSHPEPPPHSNWLEKIVNTLPTLAQGSTGEDVRTAQGALAARHHAVTVDGAFGPATKSAVEALQSSKGLAVDGVVGPRTWAKLLNR